VLHPQSCRCRTTRTANPSPVFATPIRRLLQNQAFDRELAHATVTAFADILRELQLAERNDALNELIAERAIQAAHQGEREAQRIRARVLQSLRSARYDAHDITEFLEIAAHCRRLAATPCVDDLAAELIEIADELAARAGDLQKVPA
jgi:hypothetical protein